MNARRTLIDRAWHRGYCWGLATAATAYVAGLYLVPAIAELWSALS